MCLILNLKIIQEIKKNNKHVKNIEWNHDWGQKTWLLAQNFNFFPYTWEAKTFLGIFMVSQESWNECLEPIKKGSKYFWGKNSNFCRALLFFCNNFVGKKQFHDQTLKAFKTYPFSFNLSSSQKNKKILKTHENKKWQASYLNKITSNERNSKLHVEYVTKIKQRENVKMQKKKRKENIFLVSLPIRSLFKTVILAAI